MTEYRKKERKISFTLIASDLCFSWEQLTKSCWCLRPSWLPYLRSKYIVHKQGWKLFETFAFFQFQSVFPCICVFPICIPLSEVFFIFVSDVCLLTFPHICDIPPLTTHMVFFVVKRSFILYKNLRNIFLQSLIFRISHFLGLVKSPWHLIRTFFLLHKTDLHCFQIYASCKLDIYCKQ